MQISGYFCPLVPRVAKAVETAWVRIEIHRSRNALIIFCPKKMQSTTCKGTIGQNLHLLLQKHISGRRARWS